MYPQITQMEDLLLSQLQYKALLNRLDGLNEDITTIKLKSGTETRCLDNYDLQKLLHISPRTIQRWRKSGRLPFCKMGRKYYYPADLILDSFKPHTIFHAEDSHSPIELSDIQKALKQVNCPNCPLILVLTT